jgi:hypothetical protein
VKEHFIKNFYYNRTSIVKLIFLYNYLNKISFLEELSLLIIKNEFSKNEKKTEVLFEIYQKIIPNIITLDLNFGLVKIYEEKAIFYFKDDFEFDDFFTFFSNLEKNYKIK